MSGQDEVFGLPFLFTGGLPTSLEKFTEGNLRCFLIYLIEVVGKANRRNVWQKPVWWRSKLIPYSPISVDTIRVPQDQVVNELRGLIEGCYKYYRAEKILEVSKQLAEIPRILLGIRDNGDNTMTVYDNNSKAIYVTVRPENLYYDAKSLNKVSKDFQSNYTKEDVSFCQIQKSSKFKQKEDIIGVIELSDSDSELEETPSTKVESLAQSKRNSLTPRRSPHHKSSRGVVLKSGNSLVIALSDSDGEDVSLTPAPNSPLKLNHSRENRMHKDRCFNEDRRHKKDEEVELVDEFTASRPCPKRFKKKIPPRNVSIPQVIVLSDSDDDIAQVGTGITISSYTSLAKDYQHLSFYIESPSKNVQKSILGPLVYSPKKDVQAKNSNQGNVPWSLRANHLSPRSNIERVPGGLLRAKTSDVKRRLEKFTQSSSEDDLLKPTKEELFLRKKKDRTYYSISSEQPEPKAITAMPPANKAQFLSLFELKEVCKPVKAETTKTKSDLVAAVGSLRGSFSRIPFDWIQAISQSNYFIVSKKNSRKKNAVFSNYEPFCSTDKNIVEYSIKAANKNVGKEGRSVSRLGRRGTKKGIGTIEKWYMQCEEGSQRSKRAALRMLRTIVMNKVNVEDTLRLGTLAPNLQRLPYRFIEEALHSGIKFKDTIPS